MSSFQSNKCNLRELLIYEFNLKNCITDVHGLHMVEVLFVGEFVLNCLMFKLMKGEFDKKMWQEADCVRRCDSCQTQDEHAFT